MIGVDELIMIGHHKGAGFLLIVEGKIVGKTTFGTEGFDAKRESQLRGVSGVVNLLFHKALN